MAFLNGQGQGFLLQIHNHYCHTFSQYSKEGKKCQKGSSFAIPLNPMISGTIQATILDKIFGQISILKRSLFSSLPLTNNAENVDNIQAG